MTDKTNFLDPEVLIQNIELYLPIYKFDLSNVIDIDTTISKIKTLKTNHPTTTHTNVITNNGWRSPYLTRQDPEIQTFTSEVMHIQAALNQINSFKTELVNLWAIIYGDQDFSKTHNHFNLWDKLAYNSILYLSDSNTPIVFETTTSSVEIFPKKGLLVVMHPITRHSVPLVDTHLERMALVCNFAVY
jgi:hypothetical protein